MFDWSKIDTVLLDMDGTLLDLKFDNQFWLHLLPIEIAHQQNISYQQAKQELLLECSKVKGSLDWYCIDYWTKKTNIDILQLKMNNTENIALRDDVPAFLEALQQQGIQRVLLTNAHPDSLNLKNKHTGLEQYLDHLYSTHDFGYCKESPKLWQALSKAHSFDPERTLFIDDNEDLLLIARQFGIRYVLGITNPDSQGEHQTFEDCPAINDYDLLTKTLIKMDHMTDSNQE